MAILIFINNNQILTNPILSRNRHESHSTFVAQLLSEQLVPDALKQLAQSLPSPLADLLVLGIPAHHQARRLLNAQETAVQILGKGSKSWQGGLLDLLQAQTLVSVLEMDSAIMLREQDLQVLVS
jgi:hypothetical protein